MMPLARIARRWLPLVVSVALAAARAAAQDLPALEEQAIKRAVAKVAPAVVRIETVGGLERIGQVLLGTGPTTGLVVSADGYVISSAFNFAQRPASILVTLADGTRSPARLVATDHSRALVLLKIETPSPLPLAEAVPLADIRPGQWAIAVGRTFEGSEPNASVGIVSATGRIWSKAVQTDAKISPSNYGGPLVDIAGRVLGVLVPLAPETSGETAGVEWYDSGIGFAVPLAHIQGILPRLREGRDLHPGLLGINLASAELFTKPATIAAVRFKSPAAAAGLKAKDTIVEIGGVPVRRVAELKHHLNARYAGDKVSLVVERGGQRIAREIELVDKLPPFVQPFLGVLPMRAAAGAPRKLVVRHVYPGGPAEPAGLRRGDAILSLGGERVSDLAQARARLATLAPDEPVEVELEREGKKQSVQLVLGTLPESLPGELPPAYGEVKPPSGERPQLGVVEIKLPEFANQCLAYVPDNYDAALPSGLVVWLPAPGEFKQDETVARWKQLCADHRLILLAPRPADGKRWQPTEAAFIRRSIDELRKTYKLDPPRIALLGHGGGGTMAYLTFPALLDLVHAVAVTGAPLPLSVKVPETDPVLRLTFYTTSGDGPHAQAVESGVERLRAAKHPVVVKRVSDPAQELSDSDLAELVRWIDTLDRL